MALLPKGTVKFTDSLSKSLLTSVFSVYFVITLVVTAAHLCIQFISTQDDVLSELEVAERAFQDSLSAALWHVDLEQIGVIAHGMYEIPSITGITVTGSEGKMLFKAFEGNVAPDQKFIGIERSFVLNWEFDGRSHHIGDVTVYSNGGVVLARMEAGIWTLLISAVVKTMVLLLLITWVFNRLLAKPLGQLARDAEQIDPNNIQHHRIHIESARGSELKVVERSLNLMMDKVESSLSELDLLNKNLEQIVAQRTAALNQALADLESKHQALSDEVVTRQQAEAELLDRKQALEESLAELKKTQKQLVEAEKMASLGALVSGVAHEINTPVGVCLTAITHLEYLVQELDEAHLSGRLTQSRFKRFIQDSRELSQTVLSSLQKAADLINSFKKVSVDQSMEKPRHFEFSSYLREVLDSQISELKKRQLKLELDIEPVRLESYPGAWAQVITSLLTNVTEHAYEPGQKGVIRASAKVAKGCLCFRFCDDGRGMKPDVRAQIFEPFFTTSRETGGNGLGLHIVYNLVTQKLKGTISAEPLKPKGSCFTITVPLSLNEKVQDSHTL